MSFLTVHRIHFRSIDVEVSILYLSFSVRGVPREIVTSKIMVTQHQLVPHGKWMNDENVAEAFLHLTLKLH